MENELADTLETAWLNDHDGPASIWEFAARYVITRLRAGGISDITIRNTLIVDREPISIAVAVPDQDNECDCADRVKDGEYYHCPKCDAEWHPVPMPPSDTDRIR